MGVQEIADKMKSRVESSGFDRSVKFDTGSRRRHRHRRRHDLDHRRRRPTARSSCRSTIWRSLIAGELNPTMAFMTGKIKIEGDMSVAMALSQIL